MRSILISGAAQGIGAAIARLFYAHHYKVGIYDINSAQAQQLAASLGPNAKAGQLDVSSYQEWQTALAEFVAWAGELNILVNNAGILFSGPFEQTEISAHHKTMSINVNGVLNGCHAALPYLKQANFARIINLSSASAIYGQADLVSYSASKFAVRGHHRRLRYRMAKIWHSRIRCHAAICTNCHGAGYASEEYSKHGGTLNCRRCSAPRFSTCCCKRYGTHCNASSRGRQSQAFISTE